MIKKIWLVQPLAFARVGSSGAPVQSHYWTANDLRPDGTGRTTVAPDETLSIDQNGEVSASPPAPVIAFKEEDGRIRPVCPFFELHGEWDSGQGPITPEVLAAAGHSPQDITWNIKHANLKAFHFTHSRGDRIEADLPMPVAAGNFGVQELRGTSPLDGEPLVPQGQHIPLGAAQITKPTCEFPEFRLRFYAPAGRVFAPTDLRERLRQVLEGDQKGFPGVEQLGIPALAELFDNSAWKDFDLPPEQKILNPKAAWPQFSLIQLKDFLRELPLLLPKLKEVSARTDVSARSELLRLVAGPFSDVGSLPPGLFSYVVSIANAAIPESNRAFVSSLGIIDDTGDGIVTCAIKGVVRMASARVVVCPPKFAADRRQPVSIADGLADRQNRRDAAARQFSEKEETSIPDEIADLFDRAFETSALSNLDVWSAFFRNENIIRASTPSSQVSPKDAAAKLWNVEAMPSVHALPLTEYGRQKHRRITIRWALETLLRGNPDVIDRFIRTPADQQRLYDQRMPALMRGADREPLHLTRRQYEILKAWAVRLR